MKHLDQATADEYARWFRCLSDGTRLRVLHVVAASAEPMTVGDIVSQLDRSQSTISRHLAVLAEQEFVLMEADGVRTLVRANPSCMTALPIAAAAVMASNVPSPP